MIAGLGGLFAGLLCIGLPSLVLIGAAGTKNYKRPTPAPIPFIVSLSFWALIWGGFLAWALISTRRPVVSDFGIAAAQMMLREAMLGQIAVLSMLSLPLCLLAAWGYLDGEKRHRPRFLVAIFVAIYFPLGLLGWLITRPSTSKPLPDYLKGL